MWFLLFFDKKKLLGLRNSARITLFSCRSYCQLQIAVLAKTPRTLLVEVLNGPEIHFIGLLQMKLGNFEGFRLRWQSCKYIFAFLMNFWLAAFVWVALFICLFVSLRCVSFRIFLNIFFLFFYFMRTKKNFCCLHCAVCFVCSALFRFAFPCLFCWETLVRITQGNASRKNKTFRCHA